MRLHGFLTAVFLMTTITQASALDVKVSVTEVSDRRSTGKFFNNLELKLNLTGDDVADIKGMRTVVDSAVDDSGRNLMGEREKSADFEDVQEGSQPEITIKLKNPARKATTLKKLAGKIQLFMPAKDPAATVLINDFTKMGGKPLSHPALAKAGVSATVLTKKEYDAIRKEAEKKAKEEAGKEGLDQAMMKALEGLFSAFFQVGENDLIFEISDPSANIIRMDAVDEKGEVIRRNGSMKSGGLLVLNYGEPMPANARLRIFLKTARSVVNVPLNLVNVPLP